MKIDNTYRLSRRSTVCRLAGLGMAACAVGVANPLWAQARKKLASKLKIVIPGVSRGNLDEAGRTLGDTLVVLGLCDEIEYDNHDGKEGALAPTYYAGKYALTTERVKHEFNMLVPLAIALVNFFVIKSVFSEEANHAIVFMYMGMIVAIGARIRKDMAENPVARHDQRGLWQMMFGAR